MSSMVSTVLADAKSGLVVFFVALPLCLGIALASGAPLVSGLLAGIVGGLVVGMFSGSHTSVSGPAAGLSAVMAAQMFSLGSFSAVFNGRDPCRDDSNRSWPCQRRVHL